MTAASQDKTVPARPNPLHERNVNDERLAKAHAALERGDAREARAMCRAILNSSQVDAALRHEVARVLARTQVDLVHVGVLVALGVVVLTIFWVYVRA